MSETARYTGTAKKIENNSGKTTLQIAEEILKEMKIKVKSYHESAIECLCEMAEDSYFYHTGSDTLYQITKEKVEDYQDIMDATFGKNGVINYELKYYNGGCGFEEALDSAMDSLFKEDTCLHSDKVALFTDDGCEFGYCCKECGEFIKLG